MKLFLAAIAIVLSFVAADSVAKPPQPGSSEALIAGRLADAGIRPGYDHKANRMVQTATASRETSAITDAGFTKLRDDLAMAAVLDAKAKIAHLLHDEMTAREMTTRYLAEDGSEVVRRTAVSEAFAKRTFLGMTVLCTAESFRDGVYSVTAAVGWSPRMEAAVREQLAAKPGSAQTEDGGPSPEWKAWADKQDFAFVFGPRTFVDSKGVRRYVGIGVADVEGKQGAALVSAMRLARVKASRNLLFATFSDLEATEFVEQTLTTRDGVLEGLDNDVRNRIVQRCNSKHLFDDEVYTVTVNHPLTGRAMFVSVAGVEPARLAEMNLLRTTP